jgi:hypothetical protein
MNPATFGADETDLVDVVLAEHVNNLRAWHMAGTQIAINSNTTTLTGTLTLIDADDPLQFLDPGGAARTVRLPAEASTNHPFTIYNSADASEVITVQNDTPTTITTIAQGECKTFFSDGINWVSLSGGGSASREMLTAARTYYVRKVVGNVALSIATPCVATIATHGLVANDPVIFSILPNLTSCTVTIASPGVVTKTAHGYLAGQPIKFTTTNAALPTGITAGTTYYVISTGLAEDTFRFSTSVGGAAVNTSVTQSGTHYCEATGALPTGMTAGTIYYVISAGLTDNEFQFSTSVGGAAVNTSGTQSGIISLATGSNSNSGLTAALPFLTIAQAVNTAASVDSGIYNITTQLADGVYVEAVTCKTGAGAGTIIISGNATKPENVTISISAYQNGFALTSIRTKYTIQNLKISGGANTTGIYLFYGSILSWGNIVFCTHNIDLYLHSSIATCDSAYKICGNSVRHMLIDSGATVFCQHKAITLTNSPAWSSSYVEVDTAANSNFYGSTWVGLSTGRRYYCTLNGVIQTYGGGASFFPGDSAGTTATGGQYA